MSEPKYTVSQTHSGSGDNVAGDKNVTNYNKADLAEAAAEIQALLEQLSKTYPESSKLQIASKAEEEINNNPNLRTKVIKALKAGSLEAIKTHPAGAFLIEAIKEFKDNSN
jgi:hypothetical protein